MCYSYSLVFLFTSSDNNYTFMEYLEREKNICFGFVYNIPLTINVSSSRDKRPDLGLCSYKNSSNYFRCFVCAIFGIEKICVVQWLNVINFLPCLLGIHEIITTNSTTGH